MLRRHPISIYFALTFVISWAAMAIAVGEGGFPVAPEQAAQIGGAALLGPTIAGLVMTGVCGGRAGLRDLLARLLRWRVAGRWYAVALLTAPLTAFAVLMLLTLRSPEFSPAILSAPEPLTFLLSGLAAGLAVGLFEELGWTAFAIPRMLARRGPLGVGLLLGILWGLWHLPMFWEADSFAGGLPLALLMARLFAWLPPYRALMAWVYAGCESLLVVVLMHVSLVTSLMCIEPALSREGVLTYVLVRGAVLWVLVGGIAAVRRRARSRR
ncbi:MAG: CPBP family intramembrane metalloprotease [Myxococcales bacterium]|nr:CPBP family intramembrane metalloprotease [Myxococcales bacterium]MCB9700946.1 CPBP family intramembrane metalloprotease [Myxococcales bacterium]